MDSRQLREETRAEHEATEALMPLTGDELTSETYLRTLEILSPLVGSWEDWAAASGPEDLKPLLAARRRSGMLGQDLEALGGAASRGGRAVVDWAAVVGEGQDLQSSAERRARFLGVLYVMEGSTLGGRYIARHVESTLGMAPGVGNAYFRGHGEATGAMWREVQAEIAKVPDELAPTVIEAARRAFRAFGKALQDGARAADVVCG